MLMLGILWGEQDTSRGEREGVITWPSDWRCLTDVNDLYSTEWIPLLQNPKFWQIWGRTLKNYPDRRYKLDSRNVSCVTMKHLLWKVSQETDSEQSVMTFDLFIEIPYNIILIIIYCVVFKCIEIHNVCQKCDYLLTILLFYVSLLKL